MKRCKQCRKEKDEGEFHRSRDKTAVVNFCWACASKNMKAWARRQNVGVKAGQQTQRG